MASSVGLWRFVQEKSRGRGAEFIKYFRGSRACVQVHYFIRRKLLRKLRLRQKVIFLPFDVGQLKNLYFDFG